MPYQIKILCFINQNSLFFISGSGKGVMFISFLVTLSKVSFSFILTSWFMYSLPFTCCNVRQAKWGSFYHNRNLPLAVEAAIVHKITLILPIGIGYGISCTRILCPLLKSNY